MVSQECRCQKEVLNLDILSGGICTCGASLSEEDDVVACMTVYEACAVQEL